MDATITEMAMVNQGAITASDLCDEAMAAVASGSGRTLLACYRIAWARDGRKMDPDLQAVVIHPHGVGRARIGIALNGDAQWGDLEPYAGGNNSTGFESAVYQAVVDYLNDDDAWKARN